MLEERVRTQKIRAVCIADRTLSHVKWLFTNQLIELEEPPELQPELERPEPNRLPERLEPCRQPELRLGLLLAPNHRSELLLGLRLEQNRPSEQRLDQQLAQPWRLQDP